MALNGIDIASWQGALNLNNISYDFVVIKATEGIGYVNPYCDTHYQQAKAAGKKRGVYHFANNQLTGAIAEADYFVDNILGYIGDAVLALDYEKGSNDPYNVGWAKQWLDHVQARTGVKPLIYMSESVVNGADWSPVINGDYGLWVAKYWDMQPDSNYDMSQAGPEPTVNWGSAGYAMWQWTSVGRIGGYGGNLDTDIFYGDTNAWDAYAGAHPATPDPVTTTTTQTPIPPETTTTTTTETPATTTTTTETETATTTSTTTVPAKPKTPQVKLIEAVLLRAFHTFWQTFAITFTADLTGLTSALLGVHSFNDLRGFVLSFVLAIGAAVLSAIKNLISPPKEVKK